MAYLDNTEITVDAILTKKGRQKLASGQSLNITKFALGDDEIDYTLRKEILFIEDSMIYLET